MNISGMVLGLIGGLGLFLYGMTLMSGSRCQTPWYP